MKNWRMIAGVLVLSLGLLAGTGLAQFGADWHGKWELDKAVYDCDFGFLLWEDTYEIVFCEGEDYDYQTDPEWQDIDCQGGVVGNEVDLVCTMSQWVEEDCFAEMTITLDYTLDSGVITGTEILETNFTGAGCLITYSCIESTLTGTRIDTDPVECDPQANEDVSWSVVKGIYR